MDINWINNVPITNIMLDCNLFTDNFGLKSKIHATETSTKTRLRIAVLMIHKLNEKASRFRAKIYIGFQIGISGWKITIVLLCLWLPSEI